MKKKTEVGNEGKLKHTDSSKLGSQGNGRYFYATTKAGHPKIVVTLALFHGPKSKRNAEKKLSFIVQVHIINELKVGNKDLQFNLLKLPNTEILS